MGHVVVIDPNEDTGHDRYIVDHVTRRLQASPAIEGCQRISACEYEEVMPTTDADTLIYFPRLQPGPSRMPDQADTTKFLEHCPYGGLQHLVVISSAAVYGARPHNPGLINESQPLKPGQSNCIALEWQTFEAQIEQALTARSDTTLTVLRPAHVLNPDGRDYFSRLCSKRLAFTLVGHDPSIQSLHPDDLAGAILSVVKHRGGGVYNVAPTGVITLRAMLRLTGGMRISKPRWVQRVVRWLAPRSRVSPIDQIDYIRYSWTVSGEKLGRESGFQPAHSSVDAVLHFLSGGSEVPDSPERREQHVAMRRSIPEDFDDFGLDRRYLAAYGRTLLKFLHDYYWRIEVKGLEHIPRESRALLAGVHRGFMPLDGVATMHIIVKETGRHPRFLIHPTLVKFPFQANFMTKIGGIIACQQNADYVLSRDELVGFYPEGIQGAFRYIRGVYTLGRFGRNEFVKMALRNRAPIVPFVTVGNAEIFPILARIKWKWWTRFSLWPYFPIAPPFPLLPIPLPSKWHVQFLEPLHIEREYPPEAAQDPAIVRAISQEVRTRMQRAIDDMLARRKSIFYGSIFKEA